MVMVSLYSNKTLTKPKRNNIILESCTEQDPTEFNELITEQGPIDTLMKHFRDIHYKREGLHSEYGKKTSHTKRKRPPLVNAFTKRTSTGQRG